LPFKCNLQRYTAVEEVLADFACKVLPAAGELRRGVLQNDANDQNIIVRAISGGGGGGGCEPAGLLDFGDMVVSWWGMYKLNPVVSHSLKAPGFNPESAWFQPLNLNVIMLVSILVLVFQSLRSNGSTCNRYVAARERHRHLARVLHARQGRSRGRRGDDARRVRVQISPHGRVWGLHSFYNAAVDPPIAQRRLLKVALVW
jgi:hypothetical protein